MSRHSSAVVLLAFCLAVSCSDSGPAGAAPDAREPAHQVPVPPEDEAEREGPPADATIQAPEKAMPLQPPAAKPSAVPEADTREDEAPVQLGATWGSREGKKNAQKEGPAPAEADLPSVNPTRQRGEFKTGMAPGSPVREKSPEKQETGDAPVKDAEQRTARPPGLPLRKPPKPVMRDHKESERRRQSEALKPHKSPPPGPGRDKYLCNALQRCRNEFIRCKSKIKFPDQSKEWSVAKEECGAAYKKCVEQDFSPGQWFFTRWFYFQELDCK
jgi:hypothetical protein